LWKQLRRFLGIELKMKKQSNHIGQRIRERRLALGWTQERLAKASGYSRVYVLKLENGQVKSPGVQALEKIVHCLGMELEALWK
jgi:transcriptional regulator with XRE-family HTH domain